MYEQSEHAGPLRQGEILTNLVQRLAVPQSIESDEGVEFYERLHPFAIIVTQDCDLDLDFQARQGSIGEDKQIPNILFCEVDTVENLFAQGLTQGWLRSGTKRTDLKNNKNERYHFLQGAPRDRDALNEGLPEMGIDFKRYFTLPAEEVYQRLSVSEFQRRCRLVSPYLEHFSTRFSNFLARIALPEPHRSE